MSEWRPIETAPKDGTPILVAGGEDDNTKYADPDIRAFMRAPTRAMWDGDGWLITLAEAACVGVERLTPTHWMPLPTPPSAPAKPADVRDPVVQAALRERPN